MTLSELKFIVAVAKEKNFRRAADKCFVSQPALSLAIKKLEDELNVSLFERSRTEVKITPLGQKVVDQAIVVLDEAAVESSTVTLSAVTSSRFACVA